MIHKRKMSIIYKFMWWSTFISLIPRFCAAIFLTYKAKIYGFDPEHLWNYFLMADNNFVKNIYGQHKTAMAKARIANTSLD